MILFRVSQRLPFSSDDNAAVNSRACAIHRKNHAPRGAERDTDRKNYLISQVAPTALNASTSFSASSLELRGFVDDSLGFLEAQTGLLADDLDDLDLLRADVLEDDVELGLFFNFFHNRRRACYCNRGRRCAYAEFCFECLNELGKLQNGHCLNVCNQLCLIHFNFSLNF